jgi:large subunit ribosomal protein L24
MKIKVGDQVKVIAGQDKGKEGKVLVTLRDINKVVVEGVNVHKKHQKPNNMNQNGGIFDKEAPIHVSNVKKVDVKKVETKKEPKKEAKVVKTTAPKKSSKKAN